MTTAGTSSPIDLSEVIGEIEALLIFRGNLSRQYYVDKKQPRDAYDRYPLKLRDGLPVARWKTKSLASVVGQFFSREQFQAIAALPNHRVWPEIKAQMAGKDLVNLLEQLKGEQSG